MIQVFETSKHYHQMLTPWLESRGLSVPPIEHLPATGFVYNNTAMGFLRIAEGSEASIDLLISNPDKSPEERNEALHEVAKALIDLAKSISIHRLYAHTIEDNVAARALAFGFVETKQRVLTLKVH